MDMHAEGKLDAPADGCGHVFVLHCDCEGLAADARLLPYESKSLHLLPEQKQQLERGRATQVENRGFGRAYIFAGRMSTDAFDKEDEAVHDMQMTVKDYLRTAGKLLSGQPSIFARHKPLVALPLPGVGEIFDSRHMLHDDALMAWILPELYAAANMWKVDIAVCMTGKRAFNVMNVMRERCCPFADGPFWMLGKEQKAEVERLQGVIRSGRLALLFGAGLSVPSGLPSWDGLLHELAVKAGFNDAEVEALSRLDKLDQPTVIQAQVGGQEKFKALVARTLNHGRYTPAHAILVSIRLPAVTTNFDNLYERAASTALDDKLQPTEVLRLPWDAGRIHSAGAAAPRLVKLHGCVSVPRSIVLTRQDYMRYEDERVALRGTLHQTLLERELLVVGFSMTDANVHLIIDNVRQSLESDKEPAERVGTDWSLALKRLKMQAAAGHGGINEKAFSMGTILTLDENAMFRRLWRNDFTVTSCSGGERDLDPAWLHDCFLDALTAGIHISRASDSFVLDEEYAPLLDDNQKAIKQALQPLLELADNRNVRESSSWGLIQKLLATYGEMEKIEKQAIDSRMSIT